MCVTIVEHSCTMSAASSESNQVGVDSSQSLLACEYSGFKPEPGITRLLDRLPAEELQPSKFFDDFVKFRHPVVVTGLLSTSKEEWNVKLWSDEYLTEKAGSCKVHVEDWKETEIGEGLIEIKYEELISNISAGDGRYNLITADSQVLSSDIDCDNVFESTIVEPLSMLIDDFPCRPAMFGNVVVRRIALCQGHSGNPVGISSGIKHDFHDRFCLLLRGRKRFRLFPPSAASFFLSPGFPVKIYSNGLIVYLPKNNKRHKKPKVRADGAPFEAVVRQKRDDKDKDLLRAERRLYNLRRSGTSNRSELEKAMDLVNDCENLLDTANAELHRFDTDSESDNDESNEVISIHDDDSDPELSEEPASKIRKVAAEEDSALWDEERNGEVGDWQSSMREMCLSVEDTDVPQQLFAQCPQIKDIPCMIVDLCPGELLYLPASWFYEVTTFDNTDLKHDAESGRDNQCAGNVSDNCSNLKLNNEQVSSEESEKCINDKISCEEVPSVDNGCVGVTSEKSTNDKISSEVVPSGDNSIVGVASEKCTKENSSDLQASSDDNKLAENASEKNADIEPVSDTRTTKSSTPFEFARGGRPGHLSLDYWTFPPDNDQFNKPYNDKFWPRRWNKFEKERAKVCRRSKLISSDVISLNSESSDSSSFDSSEEDEDEDDVEEGVVCNDATGMESNTISIDHHSAVQSEALSVTDDQSSVVHSGTILVGDDSEIESDDVEEDSYCDDSDVVDLDDSHPETHNNANTASIVLDEDDNSHLEMHDNEIVSSIVLDEDDNSHTETQNNESISSIVLDEDDNDAVAVSADKEPIAIDDDILDDNKQTELNDEDVLDEELLNSSSDGESVNADQDGQHKARLVGSELEDKELLSCAEVQDERIKDVSDEIITGANTSVPLIKSALGCNVQVTNNSI